MTEGPGFLTLEKFWSFRDGTGVDGTSISFICLSKMEGPVTEIWRMSLSEQSAAVEKGDLSPSEIVETEISLIEQFDLKPTPA